MNNIINLYLFTRLLEGQSKKADHEQAFSVQKIPGLIKSDLHMPGRGRD